MMNKPMTNKPISLAYYDNLGNAQRYHALTGFDPARKQEMLDVTLRLLRESVPVGASLLEIGCGSGLFTQRLAASGHFGTLHATDGADAMLEIARSQFALPVTPVTLGPLDFTQQNWSRQFLPVQFDAVTSAMALHHAADKQQVFRQVFEVLSPSGVFVIPDHMAGSSPAVDRLIDRERGRVKLTNDAPTDEDLEMFAEADRQSQEKQGNRCESVSRYLSYLQGTGFTNTDCLWRSYWLAVFVAQRPAE